MSWPIVFLVVEDEGVQFDGVATILRSECAGLGLREQESGPMSFCLRRAETQDRARALLAAYRLEHPTLIAIFDILMEPINRRDTPMDRFIHQQFTDEGKYLTQACVIIYSVMRQIMFDRRLQDYLEQHPGAAQVVYRHDLRAKFRQALRTCLAAKIAEANNG